MPDKELTVYALEDSSEIRQVISAFQKEHDDIYVDLNIGCSGDDTVTVDDALRTLNSDIMAGEGPDVIILDGMPVDNYIDKGLLTDISVSWELQRLPGSELLSHIFSVRKCHGRLPLFLLLNWGIFWLLAVHAGAAGNVLAGEAGIWFLVPVYIGIRYFLCSMKKMIFS